MKKLLSVLWLSLFWIASVTFAYSIASWVFEPTKSDVSITKRAINTMKAKEKKRPWYAAWYVWELQKALTEIETQNKEKAEKLANEKEKSEPKKSNEKKKSSVEETTKEPVYLIREEKKTVEATVNSNYSSSSSRTYYTWPKWWCYYINSNGNKSYVDRWFCN